jgi:Holliday junction resolvase RusA-like endonuclease
MIESSKRLKPWRATVAAAARAAYQGELMTGPVWVVLLFRVPRPAGHYGTRNTLRASAPDRPAVRPDVDKLARAVLDACTGIIWEDDSRVVGMVASKIYGPPGVAVIAKEVESCR